VASGTNDVIGNPMLANGGGRTAADYRIGSGSAAIAKALNVATVVSQDYFGVARITPFDIGAHQFSAAAVADTIAPSTPANLRTTGGSTTSVALTWDAATDNVGVTGYTVLRNGITMANVSGTSWTDSNILVSTLYSYQVVAVDAAGNRSVASIALSLATNTSEAGTGTLPAPMLSGSTLSTSSIGLTWTKSSTVTIASWSIYRDGKLIGKTSKPSYTDSGLKAGASYTYAVKAADAAGNISALSNSVRVSTATGAKARSIRH
jgi:chitodextrinase